MQPVLVRVLGGEGRLDLLVLDEQAGHRVGQEDAARLQPALPDHRGRVEVEHADLAGQHDQAVAGHPVPAGPQAVAVEHGADYRAVGERDQRGAVPRFHQRGVELVEGAPFRGHLLVVLPRLRDHHQHRVRQRPAAHVQQLEAFVETGRVAAFGVEHGEQTLNATPIPRRLNEVAGQHRLPGPHPVAVAADGVDLAVVRHVPVGVGQRPGRERVGGEPGVHQRERRAVPGVGQVRVERPELPRGQHPLVHDGPGGQAGEVHPGLVFGPLAQAERHPLQFHAVLALSPCDEHLEHVGQHRPRAVAAGGDVERDLAPAKDGQPLRGGEPGQGGCHQVPFGGEEGHAGRVGAGFRQLEVTRGAEELVGDLGQDPRPVPGPRVAALGTPVFKVAQHPQGPGHHIVTAASGQVRDEADAARVVLELGVVKAGSRHALSCRLSKTPLQCAGTTLALLHRHYITGRILYQGSLGVAASRRFAPGSGQVHARHGEDENGDVAERTVAHAEGVRQRADAQ